MVGLLSHLGFLPLKDCNIKLASTLSISKNGRSSRFFSRRKGLKLNTLKTEFPFCQSDRFCIPHCFQDKEPAFCQDVTWINQLSGYSGSVFRYWLSIPSVPSWTALSTNFNFAAFSVFILRVRQFDKPMAIFFKKHHDCFIVENILVSQIKAAKLLTDCSLNKKKNLSLLPSCLGTTPKMGSDHFPV